MPSAYSPLVEAILVVEQPRTRLGHWTQALAALDSAHAPPLAAIVAFYDPTNDQALLDLRYDEMALGPERLTFVTEVAQLAEVTLIHPHELPEGERKRFMMERLARCTHQVTYQRSVIGALTELVRKVKEQKSLGAATKVIAQPLAKQPPPIPSIMRRTLPPPAPLPPPPTPGPDEPTARGTPDDPILLAKGTRDDLQPQKAEGSGGHPPVRRDESVMTTSRHVVPRKSTETEVVDLDEGEVPTRYTPGPELIPGTSGTEAKMIYAKYLRSGRWVPIRIGALSLKGAALLSGALPRLHDHVDVALTYGGYRALVRGAVGKVSTVHEAAATGAATFNVKFELDDAARRQLTALLTAARAANVTIKPPPARATRRYPVDWPLMLGTTRGALKADALDVSTDGLFVRPINALTLDATVTFSVMLDEGGQPIAGRAKVVRQIPEMEAMKSGLSKGYGLQIVEMGESDRLRWLGFLARIERRAEKRILIGASPARLTELQGALAAAGYAVIGGTDPGALVQLASVQSRPVDAAMIDGAWLQNGVSADWLENLFVARGVPYVTIHGDAKRARAAVDRLLEVLV